MWLLQPKHSVESVCEELVAGLEAGTIVLAQSAEHVTADASAITPPPMTVGVNAVAVGERMSRS